MKFQSRNTQRSYFNDIKSFVYFLHQHKISVENISDIKQEHVVIWRDSLENSTQSTLRRKLYSLSSLFEFAIKRDLTTENPFEYIQKPRLKMESKTNSFTLDEVKKILAILKEQAAQNQSCMLNYAVIATLFSVGMRVSELCALQIGDLETMGNVTRIHIRNAKGKREHSPIIHQSTAQLLQDYISKMRAQAPRDAYIFIRKKSNNTDPVDPLIPHITSRAVYDMINTAAIQVGITKKISPHSCRATLATLLHNKGVPISQIQQLLNHKSITTTSVYIKKASELEEAAATKIDIFSSNNEF
jgi:integrase/recombinase XerD